MNNLTSIRIPKKYHDRISEVWHDSDGYWVILKGYYYDDPGCHVIHEDTHKQILQCIRWSDKCSCDYCKGLED